MLSVPTISITNGSVQRVVDTPTFLLERNRILLISEPITSEVSHFTSTGIMVLDQLDVAPITLLINSPGGSISDGNAIIDTMKAARSPIATVVNGMAASMAALILAAGEPGMRYAMPSAEVMIHQPLTGAQGAASDIDIVAKRILTCKQKIAGFLAKASGHTADEVLKYMDRDTWFSAEEAVAFGLCDAVCTELPSNLPL